jgi:hypothetical protein
MGTPIEPSGEVQGGNDGGTVENAPGPNPAWADVLGVIPESLHPAVTPHFEKWDQSAQQRIESLNQQVTQFESYKPFVESGISPQDLEQGLQLMYQLNTNPQGVYQALAEAYGFAQQQPQNQEPTGNQNEQDPGFQDPRYDELTAQQQQMQQGLELVAQTILQQQQQKIEAEADAEVDAELKQLKEKHPGISEEFALALMVNGFDVNQVGERWQAMSQGLLQQNPRPFAPSVLGTNGGGTGLPSQAIDPRKMSGVDRRNLVAQMAQHMMNQP